MHVRHLSQEVWDVALPVVNKAIDGYNVTLFTYGMTGSGALASGKIFGRSHQMGSGDPQVGFLSTGGSKVLLGMESTTLETEWTVSKTKTAPEIC